MNLFCQFLIFLAIYFGCRQMFKKLRETTRKLSVEERLFPRNIIRNEKESTAHRVKIANKILSNFENLHFRTNPDVEVRVVSSDRGGSYLLQTVAFLIEQYEHGNYNISICNVENQIFEDLRKFEKILRIHDSNSEYENSMLLNTTLSKENQDYWKCLEIASNSKYILLIEDDSLIISEFSNLIKSLVFRLEHSKHVDFVKLYHPSKLRKIPSYFLYITFALVISWSTCFFINWSYPTIVLILLTVLLFDNLTSYGSQFPAEIRYHLTGSAYFSFPESCCTPAVIFRTSSQNKMINYFKQTKGFSGHAKDHILDESPFFGGQSDLNYVTHIGSFSSIRHRSVILSELFEN